MNPGVSAQPDYVSFEPNAREELLSQIGGFSPAERSLFQRLCDRWEPRIDAQRVLASAPRSAEQERAALERLMAKLRTAQIGLLTTRDTDSGRQPDQVILTSQGSAEFWCALVGEAVRTVLETDYRVLPSEQRMREQKAAPPGYLVTDADSSHVVAAYEGRDEQPCIYRLRLMGEFRIIFTASTARPLIRKCLTVLRRDLSERGLLEELARVRNQSITETRRRLDSKAPDVWLDLTRTFVKERSAIAFRKNLDERDEVFQLAYLIMIFVDAQVGIARERREHEQLVGAELDELAENVRNAPSGTVTHEEFSALVQEAETRMGAASPAFSRRLTSDLLSPPPRRKLARLLYIHGLYVHATRVRALFDRARSEMSIQLVNEYTEIMEAFLRGRNPEMGEVFGSRELLNADVRRRVEREQPLLGELLARPQLLAEAIILDAKTRRDGISTEELKGVLAGYFDVDSSAIQPLQQLFGLNIVAIFDDAFARASVFRQILLRLSGRYESLRGTYIKRFGPRRSRLSYADDGAQAIVRAPASGASNDEPPGVRTEGGASATGSDAPGRRRQPAARQVRSRRKSRNEIEQVWQEFDKALRSRPSEEDPS